MPVEAVVLAFALPLFYVLLAVCWDTLEDALILLLVLFDGVRERFARRSRTVFDWERV